MKEQKRAVNIVAWQGVIITDIKSGECMRVCTKKFISIRMTADYINEVHVSCIAKSLNYKGIYRVKN